MLFNRFLLSGSSCGNAFIWDIDNPLTPPSILTGHTKEVTARKYGSAIPILQEAVPPLQVNPCYCIQANEMMRGLRNSKQCE